MPEIIRQGVSKKYGFSIRIDKQSGFVGEGFLREGYSLYVDDQHIMWSKKKAEIESVYRKLLNL